MSKSLRFLVLSALMGVSFTNKGSEYTEALKAVSALTQQEELQELIKIYSQLNQADKRNFYLLIALENTQRAIVLKSGNGYFVTGKDLEKYSELEEDRQRLLKDFSNDIIKRYESFKKNHFLNIGIHTNTPKEKRDIQRFVAAQRRLVSFNSELLKSLKKELAVQIPSKL